MYVLLLALLLVRCDGRSSSVNIILFLLHIVPCLSFLFIISRVLVSSVKTSETSDGVMKQKQNNVKMNAERKTTLEITNK